MGAPGQLLLSPLGSRKGQRGRLLCLERLLLVLQKFLEPLAPALAQKGAALEAL